MCTFKKLLFTAILVTLAGCTTTVDQYGSHSDTLTFSGRQRMVYADPSKPVDPSHISQDIARNDPMMGVVSEALKAEDPAARDAVLRTVKEITANRSGGGYHSGLSGGYGTNYGSGYGAGRTYSSSQTINRPQHCFITNRSGYTCLVEIVGPTNIIVQVPSNNGWVSFTAMPGSHMFRFYHMSGDLFDERVVVIDEESNDSWAYVGPSNQRMNADWCYILN